MTAGQTSSFELLEKVQPGGCLFYDVVNMGVRWGPSSPRGKGHRSPPLFGPCLLWRNGGPSQLLLSFCLIFPGHHAPGPPSGALEFRLLCLHVCNSPSPAILDPSVSIIVLWKRAINPGQCESYPSFQLGLIESAVVEQKADGVDLANVFVDDVRVSRVVVAQHAAGRRHEQRLGLECSIEPLAELVVLRSHRSAAVQLHHRTHTSTTVQTGSGHCRLRWRRLCVNIKGVIQDPRRVLISVSEATEPVCGYMWM